MCSSIKEGYGLTGMEAMACGAALVSSDYEAVHEYAKDGYNVLLSPVRDVNAMVENVSKVFDDASLLYNLSRNAIDSLKDFSWEEAIKKFEKFLFFDFFFLLFDLFLKSKKIMKEIFDKKDSRMRKIEIFFFIFEIFLSFLIFFQKYKKQ